MIGVNIHTYTSSYKRGVRKKNGDIPESLVNIKLVEEYLSGTREGIKLENLLRSTNNSHTTIQIVNIVVSKLKDW